MVFSNADKILIKDLYQLKGYKVTKFMSEFPNKWWTKSNISTRSRDKDGGYTMRSAIAKNLQGNARKLHDSVYYRNRVIVDRILHCGNKDFLSFFCSCDLDLDPMTFIYELDPHSVEMYRICENEFPTSGLSKVIVWQTYRQTCR